MHSKTILLRHFWSFPFGISILFQCLIGILAKFNTFSRSWKLILKFNTFSILSIPRGNPVENRWKSLALEQNNRKSGLTPHCSDSQRVRSGCRLIARNCCEVDTTPVQWTQAVKLTVIPPTQTRKLTTAGNETHTRAHNDLLRLTRRDRVETARGVAFRVVSARGVAHLPVAGYLCIDIVLIKPIVRK